MLPDIGSTELKKGESAVIAHLVYDDMFERYGHYLKNIPAETDIIITTNTPEKEARLKELYGDIASVRLVTNRGRDMSALLVGCRDILMKYEFLCFVHDKKSSQKEFARPVHNHGPAGQVEEPLCIPYMTWAIRPCW